jgi:hypothetical protein
MQNPIHLHDPGYQAALRRHFGTPHTTIVLGEVPVGRNLGQRQGLRVPDLLIAFNVNPALFHEQNGYAISEQGKPPDFVLEVASPSTGLYDATGKRDRYAALGIPEYWRFDETGGQRHAAALAGDSLYAGAYRPIAIDQIEEGVQQGYSPVLDLIVRWDHGRLEWHDPKTGLHITTFGDALEEAARAEARVLELEEELRRLRNL